MNLCPCKGQFRSTKGNIAPPDAACRKGARKVGAGIGHGTDAATLPAAAACQYCGCSGLLQAFRGCKRDPATGSAAGSIQAACLHDGPAADGNAAALRTCGAHRTGVHNHAGCANPQRAAIACRGRDIQAAGVNHRAAFNDNLAITFHHAAGADNAAVVDYCGKQGICRRGGHHYRAGIRLNHAAVGHLRQVSRFIHLDCHQAVGIKTKGDLITCRQACCAFGRDDVSGIFHTAAQKRHKAAGDVALIDN